MGTLRCQSSQGSRSPAGFRNDRGIAMLTVMLLLLILTVLGIAAVTVTGLENRMAGFFRTGEAVTAAADSCEGTAANIIQQTLTPPGTLPAAFLSTAAPPGPVAAATTELTTYLGGLHAAGRLRTDFRPLNVSLGHHVPCHVKALRGPVAGPGLLGLIPGLTVRTIDAGCSGMAGVWGLAAANYGPSLRAGGAMLAAFDRPGLVYGSTECGSCRLQMQEGTGKRAFHPVQYLAHAYGLFPDLPARLARPLGELVSA